MSSSYDEFVAAANAETYEPISDEPTLRRAAMSDAQKLIADVLRRLGWTCEYHEPVSTLGECSQCDESHARTAAEIMAAFKRGLGEFVAQHQREHSVLGGFDCCTCGWTPFDGSGCATYQEHVEAAWLAARRALGLDVEIEGRLERYEVES